MNKFDKKIAKIINNRRNMIKFKNTGFYKARKQIRRVYKQALFKPLNIKL